MATTITLAINDQFSAPLDNYAAKVGLADEATAGLAAGMVEADVAAGAAAEGETAAAESASAMGVANSVASSATMALAGAGIAVAAAMGAAKAAYDNTVGSAVTLGEQVRKLQFETGATAEGASKLAYAANITGVGVDTLSRGINIATRALASNKSLGIEPNLDGLAKLSDMYLQIEDPIQRNAFLLHEFGRSGADLAPLMELGSAGIKALGDQAQITGNVLDQQATTQLHNYDMQVKQLTLDTKGLGVALGVELAPAAMRVVDGGLNLVHTLDLVSAAQKNGIITAYGQDAIYLELATGVRSLRSVYDDLSPKVQQVTDDMAHGADASDRAAAANTALTASAADAGDGFRHMADNVSAMIDRYPAMTEGARKLAEATAKQAEAEQKAADKLFDHSVMVGVGGQVAVNEGNYQAVLDKNKQKIADLTSEIAKYSALQGENVVVVDKGKYSAEQLAVAQEHLNIAEMRLNETHTKSAAGLASLQLSVRTAQDAVDKMSGAQATAETTTADYSKKIAEDQAALDDLTGANGRAEEAMHKANQQFVFQQAAAGLTGKALLDVALKMGQIDKPTYDAEVATMASVAAYNAGTISLGQLESQLGLTVDKLNGVGPVADKIPDVLQPAIDAFYATADAAAAGARDVRSINEQMAAAHDKTVTFTVNYVDNHTQHYGSQDNDPNAGNQYAGGNNSTSNNGGGGGGGSGHGAGSNAPSGGGVAVNINNVHLGAGTTTETAAAFGTALAQQLRQQGLSGSQFMGQ